MRTAILASLCLAVAVSASAGEVPRTPPPFSIQRVGDSPLPLSKYRGKVVAVAFISTTCPHCQNLTQVLSRIYNDYESRGVEIVECAFNSDVSLPTAVPAFIKQFDPPFPVGYADRGAVLAYLQYSVIETKPVYVPHMVFLDRAGVIRGDFPGEDPFLESGDPDKNIRAELDKLLKPAATTASSASKKK
jgi:thiol-disulfide isomerase/thioredoxin